MISIIIPSRNRCDLLESCVTSIRTHVLRQPFEIIVVDTGDGSNADWAQANECRVLAHPDATFAQANNLAAYEARGNYLWLLNNDVALRVMRLNGIYNGDIIGTRLLYPDDLIQHAGIGFDIDSNPYNLWHGAPGQHPDAMMSRYLPAVTFACAIVDIAVWHQLGGLDEGFRNGYEDIDFCLRAREAGYTVYYSPDMVATHLTSQTEGRFAHEGENKRYFHEKWIDTGRISYVTGVWPFSVGGR